MQLLIWIGSAITLAGVALLVWCILAVARARRSGLDDAAMRARLQTIVAWNLGALLVSAIGLMCVIAGLFLG
ncbi:MAG: hypothetical protein RLZZ528_1216 [Pseudomonadota bacterium]|jgi:hypothetical protein